MRIPERLAPLVEIGVIQEVVRPLMSGKEAAVYLVEAGDELRVAKVYKESHQRSFHQRADYTEGRRVRDSRQQRAMQKRSRFGREAVESAWRSAEVDAIHKLRAAGVRVPEPYDFVEGVLVMELVRGWDGGPAPRLVDIALTPPEALDLMDILLHEVVKMLCAGVVHGDLSDFNVLIGAEGPVIIDFPQWVDPAVNRNARRLLVRDVDNLTQFLGRFAPELSRMRFGPEMWDLYEQGTLRVGTPLTGRWRPKARAVDVGSVMSEIQAVAVEEGRRRDEEGGGARKRGRRGGVSSFFEGLSWPSADASKKGPAARARTEPEPPPPPPPAPPPSRVEPQNAGAPPSDGARRRRRRRRSGGRSGQGSGARRQDG